MSKPPKATSCRWPCATSPSADAKTVMGGTERSAALALLALLAASAGCGTDLRARVEAAGVYSPKRVRLGDGALVQLGNLLFFERELSGNRNVACSSCHMPAFHAGDGLALGRGQGATGTGPTRSGGIQLPRNTVEPFNRSFLDSLFWDGRVEVRADGTLRAPVELPSGIDTPLQAQALLPLLDRDEMRGHPGDVASDGRANELATIGDDTPALVWDAVLARLLAIPEYRALFGEAFPDVPASAYSIAHVARAIERFEQQVWEVSDTAFDDYLGSPSAPPHESALQERQRHGAELFFGDAGCSRCHNGPLLSDGLFHNIGVPQIGPGKDAASGLDEGRFLVTGDPADRFAFRTPPLRNVTLTGPWMHDGAYNILEDAVRHHLDPEAHLRSYTPRDRGGEGGAVHDDPATIDAVLSTLSVDVMPMRALSDEEIYDLTDFLRSLESLTELTVGPESGVPMRVPSGLPVDRAF